jgi:hypothetical protein
MIPTSIRVSSVLNRDKTYGKQNLFDNNKETCWNSAQGSPQFIILEYDSSLSLSRIHFEFQGGFVGRTVELLGSNSTDFTVITSIYPLDNNARQSFDINSPTEYSKFKIMFHDSTDFYGRITLYSLLLE